MNTITLTSDAIEHIEKILAEEKENSYLRIFVQGGGCSGFTYGFLLEDRMQEDDIQVEGSNGKLLADHFSLQYLAGATVDYTSDIQGSRFVIRNPNATSQCGCGSSFSV
jgi:iron-sulfur cluster insertion protein